MNEKEKYLDLMRRYFDAETSPEEEKILAQYAASSDDPDFEALRGVMGFLSIGRRRRARQVRVFRSFAAAAAAVAILVSAGVIASTRDNRNYSLYAYGEKVSDPEVIMSAVETSLEDFFSTGTSAETNLIEMYDR